MKLGIGTGFKNIRRSGPPTPAITLSATSTAETSTAGSAIGTLAVANATGTPTFSLVDSAGSRAALSGSALQRGATALDYETATFFDVVVGVSGVTPAIANTTFRISVTNVYEDAGASFRSIDSLSYGLRTNTVCGKPAGATTGDVLYALHLMAGVGATPTVTIPDGWTEYTETTLTTITGGSFSIRPRIYTRPVNGTEGSSFQWTHTEFRSAMAIIALNGANPDEPIGVLAQHNGIGGTTTYPTISPDVGSVVVTWGIDWANTALDLVPPSGTPELTELLDATVHYIAAGTALDDTPIASRTQTNNTGAGSDPWLGVQFATQAGSVNPLSVDPARFGMPDATTAGVQDGITLTTYAGSTGITTPGTLIENVIINDTMLILADNVTFRNCRFQNFNLYAIDASAGSNLTVEYCDFIGYGTNNTSGIYGTGNFIGNDIRGMAIAIQWTGEPGTIRNNYIHDLQNTVPGAHFDGITVFGHGGGQLLIEHNTIENPFIEGGTATVFIKNEFGSINDVVVRDNLLFGLPSYSVYVEEGAVTPERPITNVLIENNYIGRGLFGYYNVVNTDPVIENNIEWYQGVDSAPYPAVCKSINNTDYAARTTTGCDAPDGTQDGNLLVALFLAGGGVIEDLTNITTPTGWTLHGGAPLTTIGGGGFMIVPRIYTREADGSATDDFVCSHSSFATAVAVMAFDGADTSSPIGALAQNSGTGSTTTYPSITPGVKSAVVAWGIDWGSTGINLVPPSGTPTLTELLDETVHYVAWGRVFEATATGTRTQGNNSGGGDHWSGVQFEVLPASA